MDTNVSIDLLGGLLPTSVVNWLDRHIADKEICISVINEIELLGFDALPNDVQDMQDLVNNTIIFELTRDIVNQTIALKKIKKIKLPDAVIAATALVHNLTLISRNKSDFKNITGLNCLNPYTDI